MFVGADYGICHLKRFKSVYSHFICLWCTDMVLRLYWLISYVTPVCWLVWFIAALQVTATLCTTCGMEYV